MNHWLDVFPLIFLPFKLIVLRIGMFFAIRWHVQRDDEERAQRGRKHEPR